MMMKISLLILVLLFVGISSLQAQKNFTQELEAENTVEFCADCNLSNGLVPFTIWVKHRRDEGALQKAKRAAVRAVLTKGIPGSAVSQPIVTYDQYDKEKEFFESFLNSDDCETFVSKATLDPQRTFRITSGPFRNGYNAGVDVEVQYENLKKYLVKNKIIKFGL